MTSRLTWRLTWKWTRMLMKMWARSWMMSIFQTCEARVCQSVHTEGRDPRLQLLVVVSAAERAFCKPYSAAPQHMQGQCIHSQMFEGSSETDLFHMDQARCTSSMTHFDRGIAHFRAFFLSFLPLSNSLYKYFLFVQPILGYEVE